VISVLVEPGQTVSEGQPLLELETDKATVEVPAPFGGVVSAVRVKPGDRIKVGQRSSPSTARDEKSADGDAKAPCRGKPAAKRSPPRPRRPAPSGDEAPDADDGGAEEAAARPRTPSRGGRGRPRGRGGRGGRARPPPREARIGRERRPAVRKLARELGIDVAAVRPSKESGRLSLDDVKRHAREMLGGARARRPGRLARGRRGAPSAPRCRISRSSVPSSGRPSAGCGGRPRATMARSWQLIPHVTQFDRADITELEALRRRLGERAAAALGRRKLTLTAIVLKVAATAVREFPKFGASLDMAREEVVYKQYVHIGVAVDTEYGSHRSRRARRREEEHPADRHGNRDAVGSRAATGSSGPRSCRARTSP
jgi:pyruvate dehydrogenase E2 component (dihydrolipoamide acetyltransferase)